MKVGSKLYTAASKYPAFSISLKVIATILNIANWYDLLHIIASFRLFCYTLFVKGDWGYFEYCQDMIWFVTYHHNFFIILLYFAILCLLKVIKVIFNILICFAIFWYVLQYFTIFCSLKVICSGYLNILQDFAHYNGD